MKKSTKRTNEEFLSELRIIHGDKLDFSKTVYNGIKGIVTVGCPNHGDIQVRSYSLLQGAGCKICNLVYKKSNVTRESFITKSKKLYGDRYDYSMIVYVNSISKISIVCPDHGEFERTPRDFLKGHACPDCESARYTSKDVQNNDDFVKISSKVHDNKYDYSKTSFVKLNSKVAIICPHHGEFNQSASSHIHGAGCIKCSNQYKLIDIESFKIKCAIKHNNRYDYSKVQYNTVTDKITIICPTHGEFEQIASGHLYGYGCAECGNDTNRKSTEDFISHLILHAPKMLEYYDFSKFNYINNVTPSDIGCEYHGTFQLTPTQCLDEWQCPICTIEQDRYNRILNFKHRIDLVAGDRLDTSFSDYKNNIDPITLICKHHGFIKAKPRTIMYNDGSGSTGCDECNKDVGWNRNSGPSMVEINFKNKLCKSINVKLNDRVVLDGKEIDILFPDYNIGIEVNGRYYHSDRFGKSNTYHLEKTEIANSKGLRLYHFWDDEVIEKYDIIESMINIKTGINPIDKIYARKCEIRIVSNNIASSFLIDNHMQGSGAIGSIIYGLFFGDILVQIMTFGKPRFNREYEWELIRLCSLKNCIVVGGSSRLFKHFLRNHQGSIISYANLRWSNGDVYNKLGFEYTHKSNPGYFYTNGSNNISRVKAQKHKLKDLLKVFDPILTEQENMEVNNYHRVYDCGNLVYTYDRRI